jgi:hypothetical protein
VLDIFMGGSTTLAFTTFFFPVGEDVERIVSEWVDHLRDEELWGNGDPLFPATRIALDSDRRFAAAGLKREHWSNATSIRTIFREAFANAGLPYFNPHSFRNTLVQLGQKVCKTPEQFKAWSQNLGHEKVLTTFLSYGEVACRRQGEIIRKLGVPQKAETNNADAIAEAVSPLQIKIKGLRSNTAAPFSLLKLSCEHYLSKGKSSNNRSSITGNCYIRQLPSHRGMHGCLQTWCWKLFQ